MSSVAQEEQEGLEGMEPPEQEATVVVRVAQEGLPPPRLLPLQTLQEQEVTVAGHRIVQHLQQDQLVARMDMEVEAEGAQDQLALV